MSGIIRTDGKCRCPRCGNQTTLIEWCYACKGRHCRLCGGTGLIRSCSRCGRNCNQARKEQKREQGNHPGAATGRTLSPTAPGDPSGLAPSPLRCGPQGLAAAGLFNQTEKKSMSQPSPTPLPRQFWALQSRNPSLFKPTQFWTGQDYTADAAKALPFRSEQDARRWLQAHKHLQAFLQVVEVTPGI